MFLSLKQFPYNTMSTYLYIFQTKETYLVFMQELNQIVPKRRFFWHSVCIWICFKETKDNQLSCEYQEYHENPQNQYCHLSRLITISTYSLSKQTSILNVSIYWNLVGITENNGIFKIYKNEADFATESLVYIVIYIYTEYILAGIFHISMILVVDSKTSMDTFL